MSAMLYISVLRHKDFAREWFVSAPFNAISIIWAAFSLVLAALWFFRRPAPLQGKTFEIGLQCLKGVVVLSSTYYFIVGYPGLAYGVALLKFIVSVSWLVIAAPAKAGKDSFPFAARFSLLSRRLCGPSSRVFASALPLRLFDAPPLNVAQLAHCRRRPRNGNPARGGELA